MNFKVLLLLAVYLFIHLTNLFFIKQHTATNDGRYIYVVKGKVKNIFRLQKAAITTLNETKAINRFVQNAALFFILLLFTAGVLVAKWKLFPSPNQFLPNYRQTYLRYCIIRI